jgi:hypothetical protein
MHDNSVVIAVVIDVVTRKFAPATRRHSFITDDYIEEGKCSGFSVRVVIIVLHSFLAATVLIICGNY